MKIKILLKAHDQFIDKKISTSVQEINCDALYSYLKTVIIFWTAQLLEPEWVAGKTFF